MPIQPLTPEEREKCKKAICSLRDQWERQKNAEPIPQNGEASLPPQVDDPEFLAIVGSSHSVENALRILIESLEDRAESAEPPANGQVNKPKTAYPRSLVRALEYAKIHATESELSTRQVATASGVSQQRIAKLFRTFLGATFTDWLAQYRISKAKEELLTSDKKVLKIALECGFGAISTFNRVFRKRTGMTPREFRDAAYLKQYPD